MDMASNCQTWWRGVYTLNDWPWTYYFNNIKRGKPLENRIRPNGLGVVLHVHTLANIN